MTMLFSFISEVGGGTNVEQYEGGTLREAALSWEASSPIQPRLNLDVLAFDPTPVDGTRHLWCVTGVTHDDKIFMTHIVATCLKDVSIQ